MKRVDEPSHAAWHEEAAQKQSRLLLPAFWGTVTAIKGSAGSYQVQVQKTGEAAPDGHWHFVECNGQVPAFGDLVQLQWQDQNVAVVTSILSTARVTDTHNLKARLTWTGSTTLGAGWSHIPYVAATYDPSGMFVNGDISITVPGYYLTIVKTGITTGSGVGAGIYVNSVQRTTGDVLQAGGTQFSQATAVDILHVVKGDVVQGYVYNVVAGVGFDSSGLDNYLSIHMLSAD